MDVWALHNTGVGRFAGYQPIDTVVFVWRGRVPDGITDTDACDWVFELLNIGDDPTFGEPDASAQEYRARGNRSLSVGDLVMVDGRFYACEDAGWRRVTGQPAITITGCHGTEPLRERP